jgi:hypothetical protein
MLRPMFTTELIRDLERDLRDGAEARRRDQESLEAAHTCVAPPDPLPPPTPISARPDRSEAA